MRPGVRLAIDVGSVRIGVARSDPSGTLAVPETTLNARGDWFAEVTRLVEEHDPVEIIVGLPVSLDGRERAAAAAVRQVADQLVARVPGVPVRLVDERHTTTVAQDQLRSAGLPGRKGRAVVDQAAASIMLQGALDAERATGVPPGTTVNG